MNFGKKGFTSTTFGGKYFKTNVSKRGTYNTFSLPGTGLSYRSKVTSAVQPVTRQFSASPAVALNRYCGSCYSINLPDAQFCGNCGGSCPPNPPQANLPQSANNSNALVGLGLLLAVPVLCVFTLILAGLMSPSRISQTSSPNPNALSVPQSTTAATKNFVSVPLSSPTSASDKKPVKSPKTARIISENANLRDAPSNLGGVLSVIPYDDSVTILEQKGVWFYVSTNEQKGWLHGNTIKLDDSGNSGVQNRMPDPQSNPKMPAVKTDDHSGATARCGDGSLSYSASHRGACSHHSGVAVWY